MSDKKKEWELTPKVTARVVGTKYPKDYYQKNKLLVSRFTLSMPDGFLLSVPIYEGESIKNKIKSFVDNWYKVTKEDPKKFDHFIIKDKCPNCGGELHAKILEKGCAIWCINHPSCDYQTYDDSDKARELIFEKHGIKVTVVHKKGTGVIFSNRPIPKKGEK